MLEKSLTKGFWSRYRTPLRKGCLVKVNQSIPNVIDVLLRLYGTCIPYQESGELSVVWLPGPNQRGLVHAEFAGMLVRMRSIRILAKQIYYLGHDPYEIR
jgi:hypothetical protein